MGYKLVLPTVCNGNVAQLASDLFIETLGMEKYAIVSLRVKIKFAGILF